MGLDLNPYRLLDSHSLRFGQLSRRVDGFGPRDLHVGLDTDDFPTLNREVDCQAAPLPESVDEVEGITTDQGGRCPDTPLTG